MLPAYTSQTPKRRNTIVQLLRDDPAPVGQVSALNATGDQLTRIAASFGIPRYDAETDFDLRVRVLHFLSHPAPVRRAPWRHILAALARPRTIIAAASWARRTPPARRDDVAWTVPSPVWGIVLEWNPRDLWMGAYIEEPARHKNGHGGAWNIWLCLAPALPIHIWWMPARRPQ